MARPKKDGTAPASPHKVLFTPEFVSSIQPGPRRIQHWDEGQERLVLEVQPTGVKTYKLYYRRNNRPRWYTIGRASRIDLKVARKEARMHLARMELDDRLDIQLTRRERQKMETFAEVMDQYLSREVWRHRKRPDQIEYRLRKYILPRWQHHRLDTITRAEVRTMHREITDGGAPTSANHAVATLSGLINWAIQELEIPLQANPCKGIKMNPTSSRNRVLSDLELPLFWEALEHVSPLRANALKMMLITGQRPGEVYPMRWDQIEIGRHRITDTDHNTYEADGAWWIAPDVVSQKRE